MPPAPHTLLALPTQNGLGRQRWLTACHFKQVHKILRLCLRPDSWFISHYKHLPPPSVQCIVKIPIYDQKNYVKELSTLMLKGSHKKMVFFLGIFPKLVDAPTVHLGIEMSLVAKIKSGFQGQKQWPPKFHIKFRNTRTSPPLARKYS